MTTYKNSILYISNNQNLLDGYMKRYNIYSSNDGEEALDIYHKKSPSIIITDIEIPSINGLELVSKIREEDDTTPIIMLSDSLRVDYLMRAVELNLTKYLVAPISKEDIKKAIDKCVNKIKVKEHIINLTQEHRYNIDKNEVIYCKNTVIPLSLLESRFLELLIKYRDKVVTYQEIEYFVWGNKFMSDAALRSLVYSIRTIFKSRDIIQNISKVGYQINPTSTPIP